MTAVIKAPASVASPEPFFPSNKETAQSLNAAPVLALGFADANFVGGVCALVLVPVALFFPTRRPARAAVAAGVFEMMSSRRKTDFQSRYGPWAVVTGASSGIGKATSLRLGEIGLNVLIVARRNELLNDLAAQLTRFPGIETRVVVADLGTPIGVEILEAACEDLDVGLLVAAAGFGTSGFFLDADLPIELEMLAVNCGALLGESLFFGRRFAKRGRGGIVLMASLVGFQGVPFSASYAATKAYVQSLAEALYVELRPLGIDVLASAPGPVRSGFEARANMRMSKAIEPAVVARETLRALGRKSAITPGLFSKILTYSLAPLTRPQRTRIMARVMGDMTKHQREPSV